MSSKKRLVLFDIDGTILSGGRVWKDTYFAAAEKVLGRPLEEPPVSFGGKTDPQICHELLDYLEYDPDPTKRENTVHKILNFYLDEIEEKLKEPHKIDFKKHPGVPELIHYLKQRDEVKCALLTGNIERGAFLKLSLVDLHKEFEWGAFGSDHANRYELPRIAQKKAHEKYGLLFQGSEIVIIGDTPHDVNCGKSLGVKSIAVATGKTPMEELLKHEPHYSFKDLSHTEDVLAAILED